MTGTRGEHDTALTFVAVSTVEIDVGRLQPSPRQPRRNHSPSDVASLAESIRQVGILLSLAK